MRGDDAERGDQSQNDDSRHSVLEMGDDVAGPPAPSVRAIADSGGLPVAPSQGDQSPA
jgi:hypothetical protein